MTHIPKNTSNGNKNLQNDQLRDQSNEKQFFRFALLPNGFVDLLTSEARTEAYGVAMLMDSLMAHGYDLVRPPLMEFEETYLAGAGASLSAQSFRVMDPDSRRMMVLRTTIRGRLLLQQHLVATALGHVLECLLVSRASNLESLESEVQRRDAHVVVIGQEHVLEVEHVPARCLHTNDRTTNTVVRQCVHVRQRIVAATRAKPQSLRVVVLVALDVHVGIAEVNLAILDLFLQLRGRHQWVRAYLKQVVQLAIRSPAVFHEVAAILVDALILRQHLSHRLHDERHAPVPRRHQQTPSAIRIHHLALPVRTLLRLVARVIRVGSHRHPRLLG